MENQEIKQSFGEKVEEFCEDHSTTIRLGILALFGGACYKLVKKSNDRCDAKTDVLALMTAYQLGSQSNESE